MSLHGKKEKGVKVFNFKRDSNMNSFLYTSLSSFEIFKNLHNIFKDSLNLSFRLRSIL